MADDRNLVFKLTREWGRILLSWRVGLEENRGDRAALRRCASATDVVFVPAYHALFREMEASGKEALQKNATTRQWADLERRLLERLPVLAGLAAQADLADAAERQEHPIGNLPTEMATERSTGGGPQVSGLRFRRLLKCQTPEELYPALRRIVRMLEKRTNIVNLTADILWWGEETRKRWAYDYYETAPLDTD